jgi:hypothetical protein
MKFRFIKSTRCAVCLPAVTLSLLVFFNGSADAQTSLVACSNSSFDHDGDGYGWENNASCRVVEGDDGGSLNPFATIDTSLAACASANADPDGDGYGWENGASCRAVGSNGAAGQSTSSSNDSSLPRCSSGSSDSDGDGYGWENNASCVVVGSNSGVDTSSGSSSSSGGAATVSTPPVFSPSSGRDPLERSVPTAACDTSSSAVRIIDSVADLADLNNPAYRVFCIANGDYRSAGLIHLTRSGSASAPRIIRPLDNWPGGIDNVVQLPSNRRVLLHRLELESASHWIIDGMAIVNQDRSSNLSNRTVQMLYDASDNILHRSLIEGGRIGFRMLRSHRNTLQHNVVRRTILVSNSDSNCINIEGDAGQNIRGNRVVSNEAYDCTDSLQLVALSHNNGVRFPGTVIANNDFYLTSAVYTDCNGNRDPNGRCSAAEGRLDIKGGGTGSGNSDNVRVLRNRIWGARVTDPTLGGSSWGSGISLCCGSDIAHVVIEDNSVFDSDRGISVSGGNTRSISVNNNRLIRIGSGRQNTGHAMLSLNGTSNTQWRHNIVYHAQTWGLFQGSGHVLRCNAILDAPGSIVNSGINVGSNYYYGDAYPPAGYTASASDHLGRSVSQSGHASYCFNRKRLSGSEQVCLPYAAVGQGSPHRNACVAN